MIPKLIHYCWFGGSELPQAVNSMLISWRKILPDYTIMRWDEHNFDPNSYLFAKEAYDQKKFAFVSDVCRLHALTTYGGVYLDTDVEVLKSFDDLLSNSGFLGWEDSNYLSSAIIGSIKKQTWIDDLLQYYQVTPFTSKEDTKPNTVMITEKLMSMGLKKGVSELIYDGIAIKAQEYFSPKDLRTGVIKITSSTYCVHHFDASWLPKGKQLKLKLAHAVYNLFPIKLINFIREKIRI